MALEKLINKDLTINWDEVDKIPEFKKLIQANQKPKWHSEGNAMIHTRMVCDKMKEILDTELRDKKNETEKLIMMAGALFHDIGKGITTILDENGEWTSPRHALIGCQITRELLWDEDFETREKVCYLVANHMKPLYIEDSKNQRRDIITLSMGKCTIEDLIYLKYADCGGSIMEEYDNYKEKLEYVRMLAFELGCLHGMYPFDNDNSKFHYFQHRELEYPQYIYDTTEFTVYVMIGIPGAGKNYYIDNNVWLNELPTVSRDDIRSSMGIKGEKPMGNKNQEDEVTRVSNEMIKEYCRKKQSFIINNTSLKKIHRESIVNMIKVYNPKIVFIYIEAPYFKTNLDRRKGQIPEDVMYRMRKYMDMPQETECHSLIIAKQM
jgi:putative nucleotidyltransferase with HDIG domain